MPLSNESWSSYGSSLWYADWHPRLFTIGYEGTNIEQYLETLLENNVFVLVDVRHNPSSRKYGFAKKRLSEYTEQCDIMYFSLPKLGVPSALRRASDDSAAKEQLFEHYLSEILPQQVEAVRLLLKIIQLHGRVALTCFEADPRCCHRHKLVEYLAELSSFEIPVEHLLVENRPIPRSARRLNVST